jgi:septum formation protein
LAKIKPSIVLASASPSRAAVLSAAGIDFTREPANIDEDAVKAKMQCEGATGLQVAEILAIEKARLISGRHPNCLVIGADQMLDCEGVWYDKPVDRAGARHTLQNLRGRTHFLLASVCVMRDGLVLWTHTESAKMSMRKFDDAFINWYLDAAGPSVHDSVGAYKLEDIGAQLFDHIDGNYFTILGLPLLPLLEFLRNEGALRA